MMKKKINISKKNILKIILYILILIICIILILKYVNKDELILLDEIHYNSYDQNNSFLEIDSNELNDLIKNKKNFAVFIYQPMCITSSDFEKVLNEFTDEYKISLYKIAFSNLKETDLRNIEYYPSFAIFKNGKVVDYLKADSDDDIKYYQSLSGFKEWIMSYVEIKENTNYNTNSNDNMNDENTNNKIENKIIELDNVVRDNNKVNIYFFWGNGCPHCESEIEFFNSIESEYSKYYNLYKFETWYNKDNELLFKVFAESMKDSASGVPYTIIGNKSFSGFSDSAKEEILNAIKEQHKDSYDVYFDKIKN